MSIWTNCELFAYAHDLYTGNNVEVFDNGHTGVVIREFGLHEDHVLPHHDWYAIAWVSLLRMLPQPIMFEILNDVSFASQADHVKYAIVEAEAYKYLMEWRPNTGTYGINYYFIRRGYQLLLCLERVQP
jgi:hypothetical protein